MNETISAVVTITYLRKDATVIDTESVAIVGDFDVAARLPDEDAQKGFLRWFIAQQLHEETHLLGDNE